MTKRMACGRYTCSIPCYSRKCLKLLICLIRVDVKGLGEKRIPVCYAAEEFSDVNEIKVIHRVCPFQFTSSISKEQLGGAKRG